MSSIELIQFEPGHPELIGDPIPEHLAQWYPTAGPCLTMKIGDIYVGAIGIVKRTQKTGEAWMMINPGARYRHAKSILRCAREQLDIHEISEGLHRVQIAIEFSQAHFVAWSKLLGFEMEGLLKAYDDAGRNYFLMARVKHGQTG